MSRKQGILIFAVLTAVVALPVAGNWLRGWPEDRCALDGAEIVPIYRVRIEDTRILAATRANSDESAAPNFGWSSMILLLEPSS